jgi:hypothetical protein
LKLVLEIDECLRLGSGWRKEWSERDGEMLHVGAYWNHSGKEQAERAMK